MRIEGTVVDGAHRDSVRHDWLAAMCVLSDVRRIEQLRVAEPAHCTLPAVGIEDPPPEFRLVEPSPDHRIRVFAAKDEVGLGNEGLGNPGAQHPVVERDHELMLIWFFVHNPNREDGFIRTRGNPEEPDEWLAKLHRAPKGHIVGGVGIRSLPLVSRIAIKAEVVRAILRALAERCENRECWLSPNEADAAHVLFEREVPILE
jgi:hypothetical protein